MQIQHIGVIGAGTMGNGIAQVCAVAGIQVTMIDISDAAEIMPMPPMTKVPNTQAWFLGLFNHRGRLAGIVDFESFLRSEEHTSELQSH